MGPLSKQQILDYEVSMIEYSADGLSKPYIIVNSKYAIWELQDKIQKTITGQSYTVRWIGNSQNAYLQAYVYVLLSMCTKSDDLILSVKTGLYQLGQKYLQKQHQKLLVEFLCLIQYTRDKFLFLRKYPQVQQLIVSILKFIENENQTEFQHFNESPTKDRKSIYDRFHQTFNFIQVFHPNQYTYVFMANDLKINVIVQKECYFIVETQNKPNTNTKKNIFKKSSSKNQLATFKKPNIRGQTKSNQKKQKNIFEVQNRVKSNFESRRKQQNWKAFNSTSNQKYKNQQRKSVENQQYDQDRQPSIIAHLQVQEKISPLLQQSFQQRQYVDFQIQNEQFQRKNYHYFDQNNLIKRMQKSQKRKNELWSKIEDDYYERKKKITEKKKNLIQVKKLANSKQEQSQKVSKQRKTSFNSYSGANIIERIKQKNANAKEKTKSTIQSTPSLGQSKIKTKERKGSLKTESESFEIKKLRKNNSNQNILNQDFKLSVIQQQNRAKFLSKRQKAKKRQIQEKNIHLQVQTNLVCTSNRQTINSSKSITFNYINLEDLQKARNYYQSKQIEV